MDNALREHLFDEFKIAATKAGAYPHHNDKADKKYQNRFDGLAKIISNHHSKLQDEQFDVAWVFPRISKAANSNRNLHSQITTLIVAMNSKTGYIEIIQKNSNLLIPSKIKYFTSNNILNVIKNIGTDERKYNFSHIQNFLDNKSVERTLNVASHFESAHIDAKIPIQHQKTLSIIARNIAKSALNNQETDALKEIKSLIKDDLLAFAENLISSHKKQPSHNYNSIKIYNFLASNPDKESCQFRQGALNVLAPIGDLFLNNAELWKDIDKGTPIFDALAKEFECSPRTIKHILKQANIYSFKQFKDLAKNLDEIDLSHWPKNAQDVRFFGDARHAADIYADIFKRDKQDVFKRWIQHQKNRNESGWKDIFYFEMRKQIVGDSIPPDHYTESFCNKCVQKYHSDLSTIKDMQHDVTLRLIRPALILASQKKGLLISKTDQEALEQHIEKVIWGTSSPSDQIAASSYWHSPRINFGERFKSISGTSDEKFKKWEGLFPDKITLANCELIPLQSKDALKEEANAMQHCVWSYADRCLGSSYHIFSIRYNNSGKRLSTLTVQDFTNDDNQTRKIRLIEHKAYKNKYPEKIAIDVANQLLEKVNAGDLLPDWHSIDAIKTNYKSRRIRNAVGYDFENPNLRNEIISLYLPCLPRGIAKHTQNFDSFQTAIKVDEILESLLAENPTPTNQNKNSILQPPIL